MNIDLSLIIAVGIVVLFALIWAIWAINQQMKHGEELAEVQESLASQTLELENTTEELEKLQRKIELMRKERDLLRKKRLDLRKDRYQLRKERDKAQQERDDVHAKLESLSNFLVESGIVRADFDPLSISKRDVLCDLPETAPPLPEVEDLEAAVLRQALKHAAARDDNWADRPFSRRYMVNDGPLSRSQLLALRSALLTDGYLQEPERPQNGYKLSDKGQELLRYAVSGAYDPVENGDPTPP
jgi:hypothetical protein